MLCSNRVDGGFGPYYTIGSTHVLTSCFDDVILEPLGSWIFLLATVGLVLWFRNKRGVDHDPRASEPIIQDDTKPTTPGDVEMSRTRRLFLAGGGKWPKTRKAILIISTCLLVALFAMHVLEIARLAANHEGVGLLPFVLCPILVVLASLYFPCPAWSRGGWTRPARPHGVLWIINFTVWSFWMMITVGIKLWSLSSVHKILGDEGYNGLDSKYPYSDKIIDNIVILCLYWAIWLLYTRQIFFEYVRYDWSLFM